MKVYFRMCQWHGHELEHFLNALVHSTQIRKAHCWGRVLLGDTSSCDATSFAALFTTRRTRLAFVTR